MPYTPQTWVNGDGNGTPLNATRLGVIETGVKLASNFYDIRAFGAACSIGTDDTTALAACVTAIVAAGGGTIWIPLPTTGCLVLASGINVMMAGGAYLQLPASSTNPLVDTLNWSTLSATGTGTGAYGGLINNTISGRFDGNRANAPSGGPGMRIYGAGFTLTDCNIYHSASDGLQTEGPDSSALDAGDTTGLTRIEPTYHNVWIHDNGGHGHRDNGPHDALKSKVISYRNGGNGFYQPSTISTHGWSAGQYYVGCHAWGNSLWGLFVTGDAKCNGGRVSNCQIEGSGNGSDVHGQVSIAAANWGLDSSTRIFTQGGNDKVGVVLSGAGEYDIKCSIYACTTKALDISGVGGGGTSIYMPRINQVSGTAVVGSPLAGDVFDPNVSGGVSYSTTPQTAETTRALAAEALLTATGYNEMRTLRGFLAWNSPLTAVGSATSICVSQTLYMIKVPLPYSISATNICLIVSTLGSSLTSNQNIATLYNQAGTKLGDTADQSATWTSNGEKVMAVSGGPYPLTGGLGNYCWVSVLSNGTTPATFRGLAANSAATMNAGGSAALTGANLFAGTNGTSVTATSTFTPSSLATGGIPIWVGLS